MLGPGVGADTFWLDPDPDPDPGPALLQSACAAASPPQTAAATGVAMKHWKVGGGGRCHGLATGYGIRVEIEVGAVRVWKVVLQLHSYP